MYFYNRPTMLNVEVKDLADWTVVRLVVLLVCRENKYKIRQGEGEGEGEE